MLDNLASNISNEEMLYLIEKTPNGISRFKLSCETLRQCESLQQQKFEVLRQQKEEAKETANEWLRRYRLQL